MFKLFRKSNNQIDVDRSASRSFSEQDHGTISAAPNAQDLLRSSKQKPLQPAANKTFTDLVYDEQQKVPVQSGNAGPVHEPAPQAGAKLAAAPGQAAIKRPSLQPLVVETEPEAGESQEHDHGGEQQVAADLESRPQQQQQTTVNPAQPGLPALCQVPTAAGYLQGQQQVQSSSLPPERPPQDPQPAVSRPQQLQQPFASNSMAQQAQQQLQSLPQYMQQPPPGKSGYQQQEPSWAALRPTLSSYSSLLQQQQTPQTVEALQQKLLLEAKAREELEDMLLRYERHLKAESAARLAAEQQSAAAINQAADVRQQLASNGRQAKRQDDELAAERAAVQQERAELEQMRLDFEAQLHAARNELAKAQASMSNNEDRIRASEAEERAQLIAEYEMRLAAMMAEIERLREELATRTNNMTAEMQRWRQQASHNAAAVIDAKNEVLDRKRELDSTKQKMDHLLEKLYVGREGNVSLSGAIAAAANYQQAIANQFLAQQANTLPHAGGRGSMPGAVMLGQPGIAPRPPGFFADDNAGLLSSTAGYRAMQAAAETYSRAESKALVPTMQQRANAAQAPAAHMVPPYGTQQSGNAAGKFPPASLLVSYAGALQQPPQQQQHRSAAAAPGRPPHLQQLSPSPRSRSSRIPQPHLTAAAGSDPSSPASTQHLPAVTDRSAGRQQDRNRSTSRSKVHKGDTGSYAQMHQQQLLSTGGGYSPTSTAGNDAFSHVLSRYAQSAKHYPAAQQAKAKKPQKASSRKQQLPDRFAEGAKNAAMITAMANKFG